MQRWDELIRELKTYPKSHENFNEYCEGLLSVFVNAAFGTKLSLPNLTECINTRFLSNPKLYSSEIINRCLLVLTRLKHVSLEEYSTIFRLINRNLNSLKEYKEPKVMEQLIRLLNLLYSPLEVHENGGTRKVVMVEPLPQPLFALLKANIGSLDSGEIIFCNSCNLFCVIIDAASVDPAAEANKGFVLKNIRDNMKFLIEVAK